MSKKFKGIEKTVLGLRLRSSNKSIKIPLTQKEFESEQAYLLELGDKNLISVKAYQERMNDLKARVLDDDTYKLFCECIVKNKE
jgi:hypothetical protein